MQNKNNQQHFQQLKWACRRGMLELDVLLNPFLTEAYPLLSTDQQNNFIELLTYPDPDIFAWIMGGEIANEARLQTIATMILDHARHRLRH